MEPDVGRVGTADQALVASDGAASVLPLRASILRAFVAARVGT